MLCSQNKRKKDNQHKSPCIQIPTPRSRLYVHRYIDIFIPVVLQVYLRYMILYTCIYVYMYVYICIYICICMYVCIYIYAYIYIYTCIYICICIYIYILVVICGTILSVLMEAPRQIRKKLPDSPWCRQGATDAARQGKPHKVLQQRMAPILLMMHDLHHLICTIRT